MYYYLEKRVKSAYDAAEWKDEMGIKFDEIHISKLMNDLRNLAGIQEEMEERERQARKLLNG